MCLRARGLSSAGKDKHSRSVQFGTFTADNSESSVHEQDIRNGRNPPTVLISNWLTESIMLSSKGIKMLGTLSRAFPLMKASAGAARQNDSLSPQLQIAANFSLRAPLIFLLCLLFTFKGNPQPTQPTEYQVKAAFLLNFAKFVEWPSTTFADDKEPLCFGVLGANPFGTDLEQFLRDKTIGGRPLSVRECRTVEDGKKCQILFVSAAEAKRLPDILKALQGANVLTVGENDGFIESGGIINFISEANKIRFQINEAVAKAAGLKISSKLLSLASSRRARAAGSLSIGLVFTYASPRDTGRPFQSRGGFEGCAAQEFWRKESS